MLKQRDLLHILSAKSSSFLNELAELYCIMVLILIFIFTLPSQTTVNIVSHYLPTSPITQMHTLALGEVEELYVSVGTHPL